MSRVLNKSSPEQLSYLKFITSQKEKLEQSVNIDRTMKGRDKTKNFWSELATILNKMDGAIKTPKQWKQTWHDLRSTAKRRERKLKLLGTDNVSSTEKESPKIYHVSEMDEAVMSVIEPTVGASNNEGLSPEKTEIPAPSTDPQNNPSLLLPASSNAKEGTQDEMIVDVTESQNSAESELLKILVDNPPSKLSQAPKKSKKNKSPKREDDFDYKRKKLELKKESIMIKEEKNVLLKERNMILQAQNAAMIRIGNVLEEILTKKI